MSPPRLPAAHPPSPPAPRAQTRAAWLALLLGAAACPLLGCASNDDGGFDSADSGGFGTGVDPTRDAGLDASASSSLDAGPGGGPSVRVRFLHALPNTGALVVCHDPDGPGPVAPYVLRTQSQLLRADYGTRSEALLLPVLTAGELTLQRDIGSDVGGRPSQDAGLGDSGVAIDPCSSELREGTIPLPITGSWLSPTSPVSDQRFRELDLLPTLSGASAVTLTGSGVALNPLELSKRGDAARDAWLRQRPGETQQAERAAAVARASLEAMFGPRALLQPDRAASDTKSFALTVFHGSPDVTPANSSYADSEVGAVRLCVTAGSRDLGALPKPPAPGIPFRVRGKVGESFEPGLPYDFRVYAEGAFDAKNQDCSTTSLLPLAKATFSNFEAGRSYTLALIGAVAPLALCSANDVSIARASCDKPASELGSKLELFAD